jgi:Lactoylglutathione lyase and related lyases
MSRIAAVHRRRRRGSAFLVRSMSVKPAAVRTHGLTHIALAVRDPKRSLRFYQKVFGAVAVYENEDFIQAQTPGSRDVLVFERNPDLAGRAGGVVHFGFRLVDAADIKRAVRTVEAAGGTILRKGSFARANRICFVGIQTAMSWRFGTSCLHRLTRKRLNHTSELRAGLANAREAPAHGGKAVRSADRSGYFVCTGRSSSSPSQSGLATPSR